MIEASIGGKDNLKIKGFIEMEINLKLDGLRDRNLNTC